MTAVSYRDSCILSHLINMVLNDVKSFCKSCSKNKSISTLIRKDQGPVCFVSGAIGLSFNPDLGACRRRGKVGSTTDLSKARSDLEYLYESYPFTNKFIE